MDNRMWDYSASKRCLISLSFVINFAVLMAVAFLHCYWIYFLFSMVCLLVNVFLIGFNNHIYHKFLWLVLLKAFPIYGYTLYFFTKSKFTYHNINKEFQILSSRSEGLKDIDDNVLEKIKDLPHYKISKFLNTYLNAPIYQDSVTKFLPTGQSYFDEVLKEISNAKKYIFIQAYVIREGDIWNKLFEILKQKARQGVEIKLMVDPLGCKNAFLDKLAFKKLANYKIDFVCFKNGTFGYGNHRKMFIVDGVVSFIGGANVTDKYFELTDETYWKQSGLKVTGDASWDMTIKFLDDWVYSGGKITDSINYKPNKALKLKTNEFVQPFYLTPFNSREELKLVYLNMLKNADKEVVITTSHIDIDNTLVEAIHQAELSGVEVVVVLSGESSHQNTFSVVRNTAVALTNAGASVYMYNGFIRSKTIMVDKSICAIGSFNFDTRPLELNFENGVLINGKETVKSCYQSLMKLLTESKLFTLKDYKDLSFKDKTRCFFSRLVK